MVALGKPFGYTIDWVPGYTGPVLFVPGDYDTVVCGYTTGGSFLPAADLSVATTESFFSNTSDFECFLANRIRVAAQSILPIRLLPWQDRSNFCVNTQNNSNCKTCMITFKGTNTTVLLSAPKIYTASAAIYSIGLGGAAIWLSINFITT